MLCWQGEGCWEGPGSGVAGGGAVQAGPGMSPPLRGSECSPEEGQ